MKHESPESCLRGSSFRIADSIPTRQLTDRPTPPFYQHKTISLSNKIAPNRLPDPICSPSKTHGQIFVKMGCGGARTQAYKRSESRTLAQRASLNPHRDELNAYSRVLPRKFFLRTIRLSFSELTKQIPSGKGRAQDDGCMRTHGRAGDGSGPGQEGRDPRTDESENPRDAKLCKTGISTVSHDRGNTNQQAPDDQPMPPNGWLHSSALRYCTGNRTRTGDWRAFRGHFVLHGPQATVSPLETTMWK